ncbi:hypothetical protein [Vibrio owensii]|uniref:hypothetical protein n=1 Tax=Vibrio owensii TaxID=696485 RepID=UPI0018F1C925|nr:hypothetical protein [Vibrio owensii]
MENPTQIQSKLAKSLTELQVGMKVKISDGTKEPPKHHTKKHSDWSYRNRIGYVYSVEPEYGSFGLVKSSELVSATAMRVRVVFNCKFANYSVEMLG